MDDVSVGVGEHLHLHVPRVGQVALEIHGRVTEELLALARRALEGASELAGRAGDAEALAAAAAGGLDGHGVADVGRDDPARGGDRLDGHRCAGDDRHAGGGHQLPRSGL